MSSNNTNDEKRVSEPPDDWDVNSAIDDTNNNLKRIEMEKQLDTKRELKVLQEQNENFKYRIYRLIKDASSRGMFIVKFNYADIAIRYLTSHGVYAIKFYDNDDPMRVELYDNFRGTELFRKYKKQIDKILIEEFGEKRGFSVIINDNNDEISIAWFKN